MLTEIERLEAEIAVERKRREEADKALLGMYFDNVYNLAILYLQKYYPNYAESEHRD